MLRSAALWILASSACAGAPPPVAVANDVSVTRYRLEPLEVHGGEGLHSLSQSWSSYEGSLELRGTSALLELRGRTQRSTIGCPSRGDAAPGSTLQACDPEGPKLTITKQPPRTLRGTAASEQETLVLSLAGPDRPVTLRCTSTGADLTCETNEASSLFETHVPADHQRLVLRRERPEAEPSAGQRR